MSSEARADVRCGITLVDGVARSVVSAAPRARMGRLAARLRDGLTSKSAVLGTTPLCRATVAHVVFCRIFWRPGG
jgi:hypothetical protein